MKQTKIGSDQFYLYRGHIYTLGSIGPFRTLVYTQHNGPCLFPTILWILLSARLEKDWAPTGHPVSDSFEEPAGY
jgi:hypothetical protein